MNEEQLIIAEVDKLMEESKVSHTRASALSPSLQDAYEQIKIVRTLTTDNMPRHNKEWGFLNDLEMIRDAEFSQSPALQEAWDKYDIIKKLSEKK